MNKYMFVVSERVVQVSSFTVEAMSSLDAFEIVNNDGSIAADSDLDIIEVVDYEILEVKEIYKVLPGGNELMYSVYEDDNEKSSA